MLTQLSIRDYVLVDRLDVDFSPGLNIITGETGAGKSIIVEALSLLLGERAKTDVIRTGKEKAVIQGVFTIEKKSLLERRLSGLGVEADGGELMVRREIVSDGKNRCFIGGLPSPLQTVKALGELLVDFHGQNEHQSLFRPESHISFLDAFAGIEKEFSCYREAYALFMEKKTLFSSLSLKEKILKEKKDLLEYQYKELKGAELGQGKEKELLGKIHYLEGGQKTKDLLNEVTALLDDELVSRLTRAQRPLEKLAETNGAFKEKIKSLNEIRILLKDFLFSLPSGPGDDNAAAWNLDDLNAQHSLLSKLKRKYNRDEEGLLLLFQETEKDLFFLENTGVEKGDLEKEITRLEKELLQKAVIVTQARKKAARKFDQKVLPLLKQMNMDHALFETSITPKNSLYADGADQVEFLVSANPGEPARPLSKIVSGGEISRVMLAIKTILADADQTPIPIFDEIDTGIGGETAGKIGGLLKSLASYHQVFCVTHSHQIAKEAGHHYAVNKKISDNRTSVAMTLLDEDERVKEITRMLGGAGSKIARSHAESLVRR